MAEYKWVRVNMGSKRFPLYVYECEDYKVHRDYATFKFRYDPEGCFNIQQNLFRVVCRETGWEVLIWDWNLVDGRMGYIRFGSSWGWKTKKDAIEDAEYEIERRIEWDAK